MRLLLYALTVEELGCFLSGRHVLRLRRGLSLRASCWRENYSGRVGQFASVPIQVSGVVVLTQYYRSSAYVTVTAWLVRKCANSLCFSYVEQKRLQGGMGRASPEASTLGSGTNNPKGGFFEDAEQVMQTVLPALAIDGSRPSFFFSHRR